MLAGEARENLVWREPVLLRGAREVPTGGRGSERGESPVPEENASISHESRGERDAQTLLRALPGVRRLHPQTPAAPYFDDDGKRHHHIFDYQVEMWSGDTYAAAVKPSDKAKALDDELKRVCAYPRKLGVAGVILLTDASVTEEACHNARNIIWERMCFDQEEYDLALSEVMSIQGEVLFHDLLPRDGPTATRRTAIWNLIDRCVLRPVETGGVINHRSYLTREPQGGRDEHPFANSIGFEPPEILRQAG